MLIAAGRFRIFSSFFLVGPQAENQICDSGPQCLSTSIDVEESRKTGIWALCLSLSMDDVVSFNAHLRMAWVTQFISFKKK